MANAEQWEEALSKAGHRVMRLHEWEGDEDTGAYPLPYSNQIAWGVTRGPKCTACGSWWPFIAMEGGAMECGLPKKIEPCPGEGGKHPPKLLATDAGFKALMAKPKKKD